MPFLTQSPHTNHTHKDMIFGEQHVGVCLLMVHSLSRYTPYANLLLLVQALVSENICDTTFSQHFEQRGKGEGQLADQEEDSYTK